MKQLLLLAFAFLTSFTTFAQINIEDSTMQVIGYWDKNETQTYVITSESFKVTGTDTTKREFTKYEVDITIKDSTASSYTIEWVYRGIEMNTDNQFTKELAKISENLKVIIKTDEMGAFKEVVNWEEIRNEMKRGAAHLKKQFKHIPNITAITDQVESTFTTKQAIESAAIKDIQQFYTYHGAKYQLGKEVTGQLEVPNLYGSKPFIADVSIVLDEINEEDNDAVIRMWQTIDSEQLTTATVNYMQKMAKSANTKSPDLSKIPALQNETRTVARIHGSGWIIYSSEIKEVWADNILAFEERIIEIK
ncbi:hypothetical protein JAO76_10410 [Pontibacter sp. BT310]|uniref:DUF4468 domain-containing protein n=1 Tax=Pontibacter populi TaxID=890055 RepID=A0ABS6XBT0_9BACT|nr:MULTISPECIES: hypothetical protein [Pontibacter]MBJ6118606.1 hypothetical protein [Pontibacter sp. BT310]MBR0571035.1 hypothetical protein [Microvirga sp. STS03]MBW3365460.1 hypothetical protein [Pontibacter populi]